MLSLFRDLADSYEIYADDQAACIAKGWVKGRGIKDAEIRIEVWRDAAAELQEVIKRYESGLEKDPTP